MILTPNEKSWLNKHYKKNVIFDEPMSKHTAFKLGGNAEAFLTPISIEDLVKLVKWTWYNNIPYFILGGGSNLLVKDAGIEGIVLELRNLKNEIKISSIDYNNVFLTASAGCQTKSLCGAALKRGFKGFNFALGIPGTIGGAIIMNAGSATGSMSDIIHSVKILQPDGNILEIKRNYLDFDYRNLALHQHYKSNICNNQPIIVETCFHLYIGDQAVLKKEAREIILNKKSTQPLLIPNAGCFFRNPKQGKPAGQLIEIAGLKGKTIGNAQISTKHANFILNTASPPNKGSADNILKLMRLTQEEVLKKFNVILEPEVKIVGI